MPPSGIIKKGNAADTNAHTALLSLLLVMKTTKAQTPVVRVFLTFSPSVTVLVWVSTLLPGLQALKSQATENVLYIKWFSVKLPFELKEVIFVCFLRSECFVLFCSDRVDPDRCVSVSVPPAASCFPSSPPLQILVHWTKGWRVSYSPPPLFHC